MKFPLTSFCVWEGLISKSFDALNVAFVLPCYFHSRLQCWVTLMIFTSNRGTMSVFSSEDEIEKLLCFLSCRNSVAKPVLQFVPLAAFSFCWIALIRHTAVADAGRKTLNLMFLILCYSLMTCNMLIANLHSNFIFF